MNLPNRLTIARICIVPVFLVVMLAPDEIGLHYLWALILFVIASYTDHLDGKIARKNNQVTNFGKFMDPLADKILVAAESGQVIAANRWGKAKTVSQIIAISAVLAFQFILELVDRGSIPAFTLGGADGAFALTWIGSFLVLISAVFAVISGVVYLMQNIQLIDTTK